MGESLGPNIITLIFSCFHPINFANRCLGLLSEIKNTKCFRLVNVSQRFSNYRVETEEVMTHAGFVIDGCVRNNNGAT